MIKITRIEFETAKPDYEIYNKEDGTVMIIASVEIDKDNLVEVVKVIEKEEQNNRPLGGILAEIEYRLRQERDMFFINNQI